jgi:hypothetical protein
MSTKKIVFCFLLFEGTFVSFFTDKKSKSNHKTVEIKGFFFLCERFSCLWECWTAGWAGWATEALNCP